MDIEAWLRELGLERYEQAFRENEIDAEILPKLPSTISKHRRDRRRAPTQAPRSHCVLDRPSQRRQRSRAPQPSSPSAEPAEAERRQLTVLFCDLVGSTELSARLDPEDCAGDPRLSALRCSRGRGLRRTRRQVYGRRGARLFRLATGARGRCRAGGARGLELVEDRRGRNWHAGRCRLAARVGIATGRVVVGELIGAGAAQEEAVVGETPNLAARLQAIGEPGSVVISQATRRLVGGLFELGRSRPTAAQGLRRASCSLAGRGRGPRRGSVRSAARRAPHAVGRARA